MKTSKIYILLILLSCLTFAGCKLGVYTTEGGKSDVAYLSFTSSKIYAGKTVNVTLDNKTTFTAKVEREFKANSKFNGSVYSIGLGNRNVKVEYEGTVIYQKDIFVTTQQNKIINLP
jgi:predicted small secreted protein